MFKKLGVISLGCDKNRVDTEEMLYNLSGSCFSVTPNYEEADIIIINTCAFIESARREAIDTILDAARLKENKLEKLIVTGCLSQKYADELKNDLPEVDCFLGIDEYGDIEKAIFSLYDMNTVKSPILSNQNSAADDESMGNESKRILTTPELYAYLRISDGCNNFCTFCTIPSIRGSYRSKPIEQLTREVAALKKYHDTNEIILVAQDVTSYGIDLYGEYKLLSLIKAISDLDVELIRLMYCYPELITQSLIYEISNNPKIAKYIDIPLQHVDTSILKLMNRKSTYESICALIELIRKIDPSIAIRTTFMVGFPSETEEQFQKLYNFLEKYPLEHVGIFAYSLEEDTPSAKIKGQVSDKVKLDRVNRLGELHKRQTENRNRLLIGTKRKAIYYDIDYEKNMFIARSEFDAPDIDSVIYFCSQKTVEFGQKYDITIVGTDDFDLIGELK